MSAPVRIVVIATAVTALLTGGLSISVAAPSTVDAELVSAVLAYGQENFDETTGLVRDSVGQPNLAEQSPGYLAALLIEGGHEAEAKALLAAILENQDTDETSDRYGHFRWHGGPDSPYAYDATLYAVPPLAWSLRHFRARLGAGAGRLDEALRLAVAAIGREPVGPENEGYLMLQAAARASAGAALDEPEWVNEAVEQVGAWLKLVKSEGLPQGHSPTFDALRLAALHWVQQAVEEPRPELIEATRLARAHVGLRIWTPANRVAGAMYRHFPADLSAGGGVATYALASYFATGKIDGPEPFAMYLLLPASDAAQAPVQPDMPYQFDTRSPGSRAITATSTYLTPEFSLGSMSGVLTVGSVPLLLTTAGADASRSIHAHAQPPVSRVSSVQSDGTALMSFDFDHIGAGSRRQAYVTLPLGRANEVGDVYVRNSLWNREATALGYQDTVALKLGDCYVGFVVGRCGPADAAVETRVRPGQLGFSGEGAMRRLVLTIYGRQQDHSLEQPMHDVRVVFAVHVTAQPDYNSLSDFSARLDTSRIRQQVQSARRRLDQPTVRDQERPIGGITPTPRPRTRAHYQHTLEHTVELNSPAGTLRMVQDLRGGGLLECWVNDERRDGEYLWSGPGFQYQPGEDLSEALSVAGY